VDLVRRLGDGALDRQLVLVGQNRRHGGGVLRLSREFVVGVSNPGSMGAALSCLQLGGAVVLYAPTRQHMDALLWHSPGLRRWVSNVSVLSAARCTRHRLGKNGCVGLGGECETSVSAAAALSRLARESGSSAKSRLRSEDQRNSTNTVANTEHRDSQ
jgi:hypothetical protein